MNEPGRGDVALGCASALVNELVRGGMRHACCSPGSRSTPLALALARRPEVELHVHLDERASAFYALGVAKATNRIVAIACTSGTAAAELFPAVVEASQSRIPLVLLTADRPPGLRGTGANQTIDQIELYGAYARACLEPPEPRTSADVPAWTHAGEAAVLAARYGKAPGEEVVRSAGPVQVNCAFGEPLVPEGAWQPDLPNREPMLIGETLPGVGHMELDELVRGARRGLVVVGSEPHEEPSVLEFAERLGWPVIAEPASRLRLAGRALGAGQLLLGSHTWTEAHRPDVVLQFGAAPTSRATLELVAHAGQLAVIDDHHLDPAPAGRESVRVRDRPAKVMPFVVDGDLGAPSLDRSWLEAWQRADRIARGAADELMDSWNEPFEGRIARDVAAATPDGATLFAGSSMPIRDLDEFMAPRDGLRVLANRGASGIDGLVSTAMGVAAAADRTTVALLGDLSFLYDLGSLAWSGRRGIDLVLVVVNNDGGAIFSYLPVRDLPERERLFTTPHGLDLGALCAAAGVGHERTERAGDVIPSLEGALSEGGVKVVEVATDRDLNVRRHHEVRQVVDGTLRAAGLLD